MGQPHVVHGADEIRFAGFTSDARVVGALLFDGADRATCIVVRRIDERASGQGEDLLTNRMIEGVRVPRLEVRAIGAPDQQRVTGDDDSEAGQSTAVLDAKTAG